MGWIIALRVAKPCRDLDSEPGDGLDPLDEGIIHFMDFARHVQSLQSNADGYALWTRYYYRHRYFDKLRYFLCRPLQQRTLTRFHEQTRALFGPCHDSVPALKFRRANLITGQIVAYPDIQFLKPDPAGEIEKFTISSGSRHDDNAAAGNGY